MRTGRGARFPDLRMIRARCINLALLAVSNFPREGLAALMDVHCGWTIGRHVGQVKDKSRVCLAHSVGPSHILRSNFVTAGP